MSNFLLPIFGEATLGAIALVNGIESVVKQIAGNAEGAAAARERITDATREYLEKNIIAGSINYMVRRISGDRGGAGEVADHLTDSVASTMEFLQPLPGVGEVATLMGAAALYANSNNESAQDFLTEYTERSLIGGSINSARVAIQGDQDEARRIASRMGTSTLGTVQSLSSMIARVPTFGLPNPGSKALENSGEAFSEEGSHVNPDWSHAGKEAFAKGINGFVTGTYIFAGAGPAAEDAIRQEFGETIAPPPANRVADHLRALAVDTICGVTEHKLTHTMTHRWTKHKASKPPVTVKPLNPLPGAQSSLAKPIPILSTTNIETRKDSINDNDTKRKRKKYGHHL